MDCKICDYWSKRKEQCIDDEEWINEAGEDVCRYHQDAILKPSVSKSNFSAGLDSDELMASIQCYRVNYELNEWNKILKDNPQMSLFLGACAAIKFLCDELEKRI